MTGPKPKASAEAAIDDGELQGSAVRAIRLLQALAASSRELSLKELAERLQLPPSTVHRLLQLLIKTEMIEKAVGQTYRPGRLFLRTSAQVLHNFSPAEVARPFVHRLWADWQETSSFCLYRPSIRAAIVGETLPSPHRLQFVMEAFDPISLLWGSLGRAILAQLPDDMIDTIIRDAAPGPLTGRAPPDRAELLAEVGRIRQRGYALYDDRETLNVAGLAAAVIDSAGRLVGSLGVVMPSSRFDRLDKSALADSVLGQARLLSQAMGSERP